MSAVAESSPPAAVVDDALARRNALVLAAAQALAGGNNTVIVATASIVGSVLAPDKGLSTLPISAMVVGMWLGSLPLGGLARRYGRRAALQIGSGFGVLSGLVSCGAVIAGSFALLIAGTFCGGLYAAAHQSYRFAAADTASEAFRAKAVSWVLAGGVFAAVLGLQLVRMPPVAALRDQPGRPLGEIARAPRFIVAVTCGVAAYAMMNVVMTSAPLAMVDCGHSVTDAALGIQWHVLAMYAPSFVTGSLIARYGIERVTAAGLALI